jgi:hypothetical protein
MRILIALLLPWLLFFTNWPDFCRHYLFVFAMYPYWLGARRDLGGLCPEPVQYGKTV